MSNEVRVDTATVLGWDRDHVIHPGVDRAEYDPTLVVGGSGSWIRLADGRNVLDLHSQYACAALGHGHPSVREALHAAVDELDHAAELFAVSARAHAAKLLVEDTMEGSQWAGGVRFSSSGSEAVEAAVLIARLVTGRDTVVTRQGAYHGWTESAAALSTVPSLNNVLDRDGQPSARAPRAAGVQIAPLPTRAGTPDSEAFDSNGRLRCVAETERLIRAAGVESVAAVITELWAGAAGWLVHPAYAAQIRELTTRFGILWINDEVISGMGRSGKWWAFQHYGVEPDIVCAAKGLAAAAVPCGATILSKQLHDAVARGRLRTYSTFSGHPLAMAALVATITTLQQEDIIAQVAERSLHLDSRFSDLVERHPCVGRSDGIGYARCLDLVRDATGKKWVDADRQWSETADGVPHFKPGQFVADACLKRDVLLFSFTPNTITFNPPLTISESELEFGLQALDEALSELDAHNGDVAA